MAHSDLPTSTRHGSGEVAPRPFAADPHTRCIAGRTMAAMRDHVVGAVATNPRVMLYSRRFDLPIQYG